MKDLYTIGIGKRSIEEFFEALKANSIDILIDVRSSPYSKFKPEFNKAAVEQSAKESGVKYVHWGEELGGFPKDPYVLTEGRVDYEKLARRPEFVKHLERIIFGLESDHNIAIFCSEGKPEQCHRSKCIGVEMEKREVGVKHIDADNKLVTQAEIDRRLKGDQIELTGFEKTHFSKKKWKGEDEY